MPKTTYFCAQNIYHNKKLCTDSALAVDDTGHILGVVPYSTTASKDRIDFGERIISPGWVDLQVNGCGGGLFNRDLNLECLEKIMHCSLQHGTTSIQPTLISCSDEEILTALDIIRQAKAKHSKHLLRQGNQDSQESRGIIGMHLEGPYISKKRRGAHPESAIRPLNETMLQKLEAAGQEGILTYITVGAESIQPPQVARLSASGISVSLGHSEAPIEDSRDLLRAGAKCFTHLYNGMGRINSRKPSTLSLALDDLSACSSIIADGHHVAPENIRIAQRLLGERLFLVTDATATEEHTKEDICFGGQICHIKNGIICNEEGSLAGSALTMKRGVEILSELFGLETALAMASSNPVRALEKNMNKDYGIGTFCAQGSEIKPRIKPRANFVVLEVLEKPSSIKSIETWVQGQCWSE